MGPAKRLLILFFMLSAAAQAQSPAPMPPASRQLELRILQDELNIENQQLQRLAESMNQLRSQHANLQRQAEVVIPGQISTNAAEIQNLTDILQTQRNSEAAIDNSAEAYLTQITAAARLSLETLNYNIDAGERDLRQLQERISFSTLYPVSATMTGNPSQQNMQTIYSEREQQINNLKEQRLRIAELQLAQVQILNSDRAAQKITLYENLANLQESISTLRNENSQLEANRAQAQASITGLNQQLQELQSQYQAQAAKVRALDSSLQSKRGF